MEREVGGGIGMGNTCKPLAVSFQCMTKSTTNKKKKKSFFSFYFKNYFSFGLAFGGDLSNCVFYELILLGTWCVSWF